MKNLKQQLLQEFYTRAYENAQRGIAQVEVELKRADEKYSDAKQAVYKLSEGDPHCLDALTKQYNDTKKKFEQVQRQFYTKDYKTLLGLPRLTQKILDNSKQIIRDAERIKLDHEKKYTTKLAEEKALRIKGIIGGIIGIPVGFIAGAIGGVVLMIPVAIFGIFTGGLDVTEDQLAIFCGVIGAIAGCFFGAFLAKEEL